MSTEITTLASRNQGDFVKQSSAVRYFKPHLTWRLCQLLYFSIPVTVFCVCRLLPPSPLQSACHIKEHTLFMAIETLVMKRWCMCPEFSNEKVTK